MGMSAPNGNTIEDADAPNFLLVSMVTMKRFLGIDAVYHQLLKLGRENATPWKGRSNSIQVKSVSIIVLF